MKKLRGRLARIAAAAVLAAMCCAVQASANQQLLPILMYHNLTVNANETNSMTITDTRFRRDMEFLQQYGYTPLLSADLINIKSGAKPMPQRPVMITFDDGYESNYQLGFPILKATGMKATISLITSHIRDGLGNGLPKSMTWDEAKEMYDSGFVDIGSHTHAMHNEATLGIAIAGGPNGIQRKRGENYAAYQARIGSDIAESVRLIQAHLGPDVHVWYFSYPFGAADGWFGQILLDNKFYVSTVTVPRTADIANGLYGLPRYRITMEKTVSELLQHSAYAQPTVLSVALDGQAKSLPAYQINGDNYVNLRDIAVILNGSARQFSVYWSGSDFTLSSGQLYQADGKELAGLGSDVRTGKSMIGQVNINGTYTTVAAYGVGSNYYFNLRNLGQKLGFQVGWDEINRVVIIKTV